MVYYDLNEPKYYPKNINLLDKLSKKVNQKGGDKVKYPKESDKSFYEKIEKIFKNYKITQIKKTTKEICFPKKFQLQIPQKFLPEYISPKTPYKELLVYHQIGSGKTCAAAQIGEIWKKKRKIIFVVPASLLPNIHGELRSECVGEAYLTKKERERLSKLKPKSKEYKKIIQESDKRINKYYTIISYNKFITACEKKKMSLNNAVLIIDEIQNLISEEGKYYEVLSEAIKGAPEDLRICLLSATPIFDKPTEIALTLNLLRPEKLYPTGNAFLEKFTELIEKKDGSFVRKAKNLDLFKKMAKGRVSYFRGAPPIAFPEQKLKIVKCTMEDFQYKSYKKVLENDKSTSKISKKQIEEADLLDLPNNFFIGTRMISNVAFPNMKTGETGFKSFNKSAIKNLNNLKKYSVKFYTILKKVKKCKGTVFIYSNFKEYGGIKSLVQVLEAHGYKSYKNNGEGKNRFAIWSGDEKNEFKDEVKNIFNHKDNANGSKIKIILGSPSIKEGVSLLRVKQAHVLEPYWNWSRMNQVIGRVIRFCSHRDVPKDERYVDVYIYITKHPKIEKTVDQYIQEIANKKRAITQEFEHALKECAVDCRLNKNANMSKGDKPINCA